VGGVDTCKKQVLRQDLESCRQPERVTLDLATIPGDAELAEGDLRAQRGGLKRLRQMQSGLEESR
jgi:hypothetical protein